MRRVDEVLDALIMPIVRIFVTVALILGGAIVLAILGVWGLR